MFSASPKEGPPPRSRRRNGRRYCHHETTHVSLRGFGTASSEDGWANLATVGSLTRKWRPHFDSRNWGYTKLSELVRATEQFQLEPMATGHRGRLGGKPQ
jgi:hypothetical protein